MRAVVTRLKLRSGGGDSAPARLAGERPIGEGGHGIVESCRPSGSSTVLHWVKVEPREARELNLGKAVKGFDSGAFHFSPQALDAEEAQAKQRHRRAAVWNGGSGAAIERDMGDRSISWPESREHEVFRAIPA